MGYKELVAQLRSFSKYYPITGPIESAAADAIETMLEERDAAVEDLTRICQDNPDVCQYCKHMPCAQTHGRCIGFEWRGPQKEV